MGRTRAIDLSPLGRLNSRLPAGIKATLKRTGALQLSIFYEVATSYVDPLGRQVKVNLGAFPELIPAIKTLFNWKLEMALKELPIDILRELQADIKKEIIIKGEELSKVHESAQVNQVAQILVDQATQKSFFAILDLTPFHLIPVEGEMKCEDGTIIPAAVIAGWYAHKQKQLDAQARMGASSHCDNDNDNSQAFPEEQASAEETEQVAVTVEYDERVWTAEQLAEFERYRAEQEAENAAEDS